MKLSTKSYLFLLTGLLLFSGCSLQQMVKMAKDQELEVTPSPLEVHGDSVKFTMSAKLPVKMLKKNRIYTVDPYYQYGEEKIELKDLEFNANDFSDATNEEPSLSEEFSFAYNPNIGNGNLTVVGIASNLDKTKSRETDPLPIAEGIIRTSRLVEDISAVAYADHGYNTKEELVPTKVNFYFNQGSAQLRGSEIRTTGRKLDAFIAEKNVTRTVNIIGQHSPEGSERVNTSLAKQRANVIEDYYKSKMRQYDYKGMADSINFVTKGVVFDWSPLKTVLDTTDILTEEQEQQVVQVVNGSGSFEEKESKLQQLPFYNKLLREVYPILRVARTEILTVKEKKSRAEIELLTDSILAGNASWERLSPKELGYASTLTNDLERREEIYQILVDSTDSWWAHNNLGAIYLERAQKAIDDQEKNSLRDRALNQFDIALKQQEAPEPYINRATAYSMQNMKEEARQAIEKAVGMSMNSETAKAAYAVKGTLEVKAGKYDMAKQSFSKASDSADVLFNIGLSNLLTQSYQSARNNFEFAAQKKDNFAKAYYAAAVAGARMEDEGYMLNNLKRAVEMDQQYTQKALGDLEFRNYWESAEFESAVQ